ncbi:MAG: glycosyltransferase, partial [Pseudomonadota bacterium]
NTEVAMRWLAPRCGNAIAISSRLERHFAAAGCRTVRIPPTLDVSAIDGPCRHRLATEPLTLSYAGTPGHKERLGPLLCALERLSSPCLRLKIAGIDTDGLMALRDVRALGLARLPPGVEVLGKLGHADALSLTRGADFSVLLRPKARFAEAGFPTKAVESLAAGTPVFGNLTSDLGDHLVDMRSAVLVKEISVDGILAALHRLLALPTEALNAMRLTARETAVTAFDYRNYVAALDAFVCGLRPGLEPRLAR